MPSGQALVSTSPRPISSLLVLMQVGGLIVLLLFRLRRTIEDSISMFESLARYAFASSLVRLFFFSWIFNLFTSFFSDSRYRVARLEKCLDQAYGGTQKVFDYPLSGQSDTKVAVTATTTSDSTLCLFSNYNANTQRTGTQLPSPLRCASNFGFRLHAISSQGPYPRSPYP